MDLTAYRNSQAERQRVGDLLGRVPDGIHTAIDIGARDGFISSKLADRSVRVTALDLERPTLADSRIVCVKGNATALDFEDASFDLVFCAEVLEHIAPPELAKACRELVRVSRRYVLIGVPYKQDIRQGRTTCRQCGRTNPPWGHVNAFDERRLATLFAGCSVLDQAFVGEAEMGTNWIAAGLMSAAGNPFGTYEQEEPCVHCGAALRRPPDRTVVQKVCTRLAEYTRTAQRPFFKPRGNWLHVLFERPRASGANRHGEGGPPSAVTPRGFPGGQAS